MAGSTIVTLGPAIIDQIAKGLLNAVYRYVGLYQILAEPGPPVGGVDYPFDVIVAGNLSAEKFTSSDDPVPLAGYQQVITVRATWQNYRILMQIRGDALRAAGGQWGEMAWTWTVDGQNIEARYSLEDLKSLMGQDSISSAVHALGQMDDDSVFYWDTDRTGLPALQSAVVPAGGNALSRPYLNTLLAQTRGIDAGGVGHHGKPTLLLMGDTQSARYDDLAGPQVYSPVATDISGTRDGEKVEFSKCLPIVLSGMAANVVYATDTSVYEGEDVPHWEVINHEFNNNGLSIIQLGPTNESQTTMMVMSNAIINRMPRRDGKLENLQTP